MAQMCRTQRRRGQEDAPARTTVKATGSSDVQ